MCIRDSGGTGAGKSTLIQLMMRFYDVTEGRILLEGKDIRSWDKQELRKKFGAAFQNDVIFEDSIAENISFGRNLSREEILEAVHLAQADTFVQEKGLDAKLAIKGADLSEMCIRDRIIPDMYLYFSFVSY